MLLQDAQKLICGLKLSYGINHNLSQPYHTVFSLLYCMTSFFACMCNILLLTSLHIHHKNKPIVSRSLQSITRWASQHNSSRRSKLSEKTRDHLIGYLAMFDLLLSLTMPLTALDVLTKYWNFSSIYARCSNGISLLLVNGDYSYCHQLLPSNS